MKKIGYSILALIFAFSCLSPKENKTPSLTMNIKSNERVVVYQMMTRLFGNTNQTNTPWGTIEENGVGKFEDISSKALSELKKSGYTHIWYTGVIEHAVLTDYSEYGIPLDDADVVKGRAGSPYAIKDYYDVNPDLAVQVNNRMQEFESLIARTHESNLKVIVDCVPNHVARSYKSDSKPEGVLDFGETDNTDLSFSSDNNFYYLPGTSFQVPEGYNSLGDHSFPTKDGMYNETPAKVSGNDVFSAKPSIYDWFETVKLNYGVDYQNNRNKHFDPTPDTWIKMRDILSFWAEKGVDGFRCDMAEMVPVEFWQWVTKELKSQYPELIFIAEIYNPNAYRDYIFTGGFDYLYDKVELYDTLKHIIQKKASTDDITTIWQRQEGIGKHMLRFLENHDEQRIASPDFAGNMWKGIPMMAATAFMHTGPVMMYFGQEVGEPGAGYSGFGGDDGRTTIFDYWGVPEHIKWVNNGAFDGGQLNADQSQLRADYDKILKAVNDMSAIREGDFYDLHYYNRNDLYTGYSNNVYAFLRYHESQRLLIVINFGETNELVAIKIPEDAWNAMTISKESVQIDSSEYNRIEISNQETDSSIKLEIPAMNYIMLEIN